MHEKGWFTSRASNAPGERSDAKSKTLMFRCSPCPMIGLKREKW